MPILPNARLVAQLARRTENQFYGDTALLKIDKETGAVDEYNNPVVTTQSVPINCSFSDTSLLSSYEMWKNYGDIGQIAGEIRFKGPRPTKGNRVEILTRFDGSPLPPEELEIIMISDRAALGLVCALKAVEL